AVCRAEWPARPGRDPHAVSKIASEMAAAVPRVTCFMPASIQLAVGGCYLLRRTAPSMVARKFQLPEAPTHGFADRRLASRSRDPANDAYGRVPRWAAGVRGRARQAGRLQGVQRRRVRPHDPAACRRNQRDLGLAAPQRTTERSAHMPGHGLL